MSNKCVTNVLMNFEYMIQPQTNNYIQCKNVSEIQLILLLTHLSSSEQVTDRIRHKENHYRNKSFAYAGEFLFSSSNGNF